VVAVVGTVVVYDVDGGVVSPVEVGGVVDVTVDHIVELFKFPIVQPSANILQHFYVFSFIRIYLFIFQKEQNLTRSSCLEIKKSFSLLRLLAFV